MENITIDITSLVMAIFSVIAFIITLVRTGSVKKALEALRKGVIEDMDYRNPDYRQSGLQEAKDGEKPIKDDSAQSFTNLQKQYTLNRHTNELEEKPDKVDLQSMINSSVESAFDKVLQRLLPIDEKLPETIENDYDKTIDDLDDLAQAMDIAEEYREKLGLPLEMSISDIYKKIGEYNKDLSNKIENYKKGVKENGIPSENQQTQKQTPIQEHSEESA